MPTAAAGAAAPPFAARSRWPPLSPSAENQCSAPLPTATRRRRTTQVALVAAMLRTEQSEDTHHAALLRRCNGARGRGLKTRSRERGSDRRGWQGRPKPACSDERAVTRPAPVACEFHQAGCRAQRRTAHVRSIHRNRFAQGDFPGVCGGTERRAAVGGPLSAERG